MGGHGWAGDEAGSVGLGETRLSQQRVPGEGRSWVWPGGGVVSRGGRAPSSLPRGPGPVTWWARSSPTSVLNRLVKLCEWMVLS